MPVIYLLIVTNKKLVISTLTNKNMSHSFTINLFLFKSFFTVYSKKTNIKSENSSKWNLLKQCMAVNITMTNFETFAKLQGDIQSAVGQESMTARKLSVKSINTNIMHYAQFNHDQSFHCVYYFMSYIIFCCLQLIIKLK